MKIRNIGKFIRSIIIVLGMLLLLTLTIGNKTLSHKETEYTTLCVIQGDTLWSLAKGLQSTNDYYKGKDVRDIIDDLVAINNLGNKALSIDQELTIPII